MREIASELVVSLNTIKTPVQSLYRKLDANSRETALMAAHTWQFLSFLIAQLFLCCFSPHLHPGEQQS